MADRNLVTYEEPRNEHGPHWLLEVDRSAAGPPAGVVAISYKSADGSLPEQQMAVAVDDLRVLEPALQWANLGHMTSRPLAEVAAELGRQNTKWGEQNHPDGTGPGVIFGLPIEGQSYAEARDRIRRAVDDAAEHGETTWRGVLLEELFEALAEDDTAKLRAELIQTAAVAVQWVAAIDRRRP